MSIETSYGFRSAQAAWENANPYDDECTCEGEGLMCDECGQACDCTEPECCGFPMRELTQDEIAEHFPSQKCPQHGWCTGCYSPKCEDCAP